MTTSEWIALNCTVDQFNHIHQCNITEQMYDVMCQHNLFDVDFDMDWMKPDDVSEWMLDNLCNDALYVIEEKEKERYWESVH